MAKSKNESNNENSGTLLTEKDGTQYFVMGKVRHQKSEEKAKQCWCHLEAAVCIGQGTSQ